MAVISASLRFNFLAGYLQRGQVWLFSNQKWPCGKTHGHRADLQGPPSVE
jgi:hypothetical protein